VFRGFGFEGRGILIEEEMKRISSFRGIVAEFVCRFVDTEFEWEVSEVRWLLPLMPPVLRRGFSVLEKGGPVVISCVKCNMGWAFDSVYHESFWPPILLSGPPF
jgi:hypothetical protein